MVAHPPCTYLANSGVRWLYKDGYRDVYNAEGEIRLNEERLKKMTEASKFFWDLCNAPIPHVCVENPIPHGWAGLPDYHQIIQSWMFGEDASKKTCLWLKNLPELEPTNVLIKERYANQTLSGQNKLGPSKDRWKDRSRTYQGIADAMADQWMKYLRGL